MKPPGEAGGGGMTGATGDLTPDDADRPFVPAELRDISDRPPRAESPAEPDRDAQQPGAPTSQADVASVGGDEFADHDEHF
jgi:hypothetical protein